MTISICVGSSCHLKGSRQIIERLKFLIAENGLSEKIEICGVLCMNNCMNGVCVKVDEKFFSLKPETTDGFFKTEILPNV